MTDLRRDATSTTHAAGAANEADLELGHGSLEGLLALAQRVLVVSDAELVLLEAHRELVDARDANVVFADEETVREVARGGLLPDQKRPSFLLAAALGDEANLLGVLRVSHDKARESTTDEMFVLDSLAKLATGHLEAVLRLAAAQEELQTAAAAAAERNELLYRLSHDLRSPLTAVLGFAQLLRLVEGLDGHAEDCIDAIQNGGQELLTLIDEVVELIRLDVGEMDISATEVSVLAVIDEAVNAAAAAARRRNVRVQLDESLDTLVWAEHDHLRHVVIQLLQNAIRHSPADGSVTLTVTRPQPDRVRLGVRDNGAGIALSDQDLIFQPLQRLADGSRTGLGMTVARRLVEAMSGRVGVDSHPGAGATFWVDLPDVPATSDRNGA